MSNPTPTPAVENPLAKKIREYTAAYNETVSKINELNKHALHLEGALSSCNQMLEEEKEAARQADAVAKLAAETAADCDKADEANMNEAFGDVDSSLENTDLIQAGE